MTTDHTDLTALARTALLEVTEESTVGSFAGTTDEGDGVVSVLFANRMAGYPGWRWTVSVAHVEGEDPSVLEVELMPGDGSLLAPEWVPWSERLADYRAAQEGVDEADVDGAEDDESDDDDESDEDEDFDDADDDSDDDADDDESDDDDDADDDDFDDDEDDLAESDDDEIEGVDVDELDEQR
ncbi:DNA primase [Curtobacterium sp. MMLR14_010]|nr:DNA primase [Curtobacterium sp. MMLR14_010]